MNNITTTDSCTENDPSVRLYENYDSFLTSSVLTNGFQSSNGVCAVKSRSFKTGESNSIGKEKCCMIM